MVPMRNSQQAGRNFIVSLLLLLLVLPAGAQMYFGVKMEGRLSVADLELKYGEYNTTNRVRGDVTIKPGWSPSVFMDIVFRHGLCVSPELGWTTIRAEYNVNNIHDVSTKEAFFARCIVKKSLGHGPVSALAGVSLVFNAMTTQITPEYKLEKLENVVADLTAGVQVAVADFQISARVSNVILPLTRIVYSPLNNQNKFIEQSGTAGYLALGIAWHFPLKKK